jgi:hypothetical protein
VDIKQIFTEHDALKKNIEELVAQFQEDNPEVKQVDYFHDYTSEGKAFQVSIHIEDGTEKLTRKV